MQRLTQYCTDHLVRRGAVAEGDRAVYEYGFSSLFSNIANVAAIGALAVLLRQLPQTILFHLVFIPLRGCAGGYHAGTRLRCFALSLGTWLLSLLLIRWMQPFPVASMAIASASCLTVWLLAPIDHQNHPASAAKKRKMRRRARGLSALFAALTVATGLLRMQSLAYVPPGIAVALFALAVSLACAALLKKHARRETEGGA